MGMCCFDVTRSLTVAGRLWSKDVNRTKTITANSNADMVQGAKDFIAEVKTNAMDTFTTIGDALRTPQMLYA